MISSKTHRRALPEVNASSMADIAFLLLVFFLVTTIIDTEKGITVKLPPFDQHQPPQPITERNLFSVRVNFANQLFVENEPAQVHGLRALAKMFILNPSKDPALAISPTQAVVSLQNDRSTSYSTYLTVYNELKAAYHEIWDEAAAQRFGSRFDELSRAEQALIRKDFPLVIAELDLVDFNN